MRSSLTAWPGLASASLRLLLQWSRLASASLRLLCLAAGQRVLDAAEPAVEAHAADALLVARQAQADVVGGPGLGLRGEVGIGDLAANDADQIAMALGKGPLGLQRILETTDADDRQVDRLANRGRDEHRVARRDVHARLDHEQARGGNADRGVDVVDLPRRLDEPGDLDRVVDRRAALDQLVAADAHAEGQSVADHSRGRRRRCRSAAGSG